MTIFNVIKQLHDNELLRYLHEEIEIKGKHEDVIQVNTDLSETRQEPSTLQWVLILRKTAAVVLKLIEIGGKQLVMKKNNYEETVLHTLCRHHAPIQIFVKLIEIGGQELVMAKSKNGHTALHYACMFKAPFDIFSKLVETGDQELVMQINCCGSTALHFAWKRGVSTEIFTKLVDVGGRDLVMIKNDREETALHQACKYCAPTTIISRCIEIGGPEILMEKDERGCVALHYRHFLCPIRPFEESFILMVKEGISAQVGGEFGIGGLFNCADSRYPTLQRKIFNRWEDYAPTLEIIMESLQQTPPLILHAAIIAKSYQRIIMDIIARFDCILTRDSLNRIPIQVAVEVGLKWNEGMKELVEETAAHQQRPTIHVAAHYGLKWSNHMRELVESNADEVVHGYDSLTRLPLFMSAAMGNGYDLGSIYGMLRMCPTMFDEVQFASGRSKKRKREG